MNKTQIELDYSDIDWIIIGAVTGTKQELSSLKVAADLMLRRYGNRWVLQPKIEWLQEIVEAADKAGIPVFLKDNLRPLLDPTSMAWAFKCGYYCDPDVGHVDCQLRQEMPTTYS